MASFFHLVFYHFLIFSFLLKFICINILIYLSTYLKKLFTDFLYFIGSFWLPRFYLYSVFLIFVANFNNFFHFQNFLMAIDIFLQLYFTYIYHIFLYFFNFSHIFIAIYIFFYPALFSNFFLKWKI